MQLHIFDFVSCSVDTRTPQKKLVIVKFLNFSANKSLQGFSHVTNKETLNSENLKREISCISNITSYWGECGVRGVIRDVGTWVGGGSSGICFANP